MRLLFGNQIKISILKKVDSLFKKGLEYYIDPKDLKESKEESIFFRKDTFNAELSFGAKQIITHFEEEKIGFCDLVNQTLPKPELFEAKNEDGKLIKLRPSGDIVFHMEINICDY